MWAAIASAAAAAIAGAVRTVGGVKTAKLNKEIENAKILQAQKNEAYYKAQANQNPLNANRAVINEYNKYANDKLRATENTNTILGRTPDNTVATQKKLAQGQAEMLGQIGQAHERNRNEYLDKANQASNYVTQAKLDTKANNLAQWNTTMQNATTAATNMINAFGSIDSGKTPKTTSANSVSNVSNANLNRLKQQNIEGKIIKQPEDPFANRNSENIYKSYMNIKR